MWRLTYDVIEDGRDPLYGGPDYQEMYDDQSIKDYWDMSEAGFKPSTLEESYKELIDAYPDLPSTISWVNMNTPIFNILHNLKECVEIMEKVKVDEENRLMISLSGIKDALAAYGPEMLAKVLMENRVIPTRDLIIDNSIFRNMFEATTFITTNNIRTAQFRDSSRLTELNSQTMTVFVKNMYVYREKFEDRGCISGPEIENLAGLRWSSFASNESKVKGVYVPYLVYISYRRK